jgi:hypothetical protein
MSIRVDGSDETKLAVGAISPVPIKAGFTRPVFSPDGTKIAFAGESTFDTDASIRIMDPDGNNEVRITDNAGVEDRQPSWQRTSPPDTTGVYLPSTGQWLLRNSNTSGDPDIIVTFGGQPGDLPVPGDWDGDGQTEIGIFRNGTFIRARLVTIETCITCPPLAFADVLGSVSFGQAGDLPVAGDWDGDGKDDVGVFRPDINQGAFLLRVPEVFQACTVCPPQTFFVTQTIPFGVAGHLPVAGDWDGDGRDDIGTYDPLTTNAFLSVDLIKATFVFQLGQPGDRPLAGDWLGSGRDGFGVFQPPDTMALAADIGAPPDNVFTFGVAEGLPVAGHWTPLP